MAGEAGVVTDKCFRCGALLKSDYHISVCVYPDDLPPEAQGLPSDGLYGCSASEFSLHLTRARVERMRYIGDVLDWTPDWRSMPFAVARAWLLKDMGLTDA